MPDWQSVGAHRYYVDGSLFVLEMNGTVSLAEITELLQPQEALFDKYERVLTLSLIHGVELPSPEVRKFLAERGKRVDIRRLHTVVVTQNVVLRSIIRLVERATSMITGSPLYNTFVSSEAEAWQWVEEQRRQHPPTRRDTP